MSYIYVPYNTKEIRPAYVSKYNSICRNQVILLMITDEEKWHYLPVKELSALFYRVPSTHDGDFYCLHCLHLFRTENKLK